MKLFIGSFYQLLPSSASTSTETFVCRWLSINFILVSPPFDNLRVRQLQFYPNGSFVFTLITISKQAGAELCQAQVKLVVIVDVVEEAWS